VHPIPQLDSGASATTAGAQPAIMLAWSKLAKVVDAATMIAMVAGIAEDHFEST
jgi:hypothetical protein